MKPEIHATRTELAAPDATPRTDAELITCRDRQDWLVQRTKGVGSSDSPAILGQAGDWANAVSVWGDKTSPALFGATSERQRWGLDLEGPITTAYVRKFGGEVKRWPQTVLARSRQTPIMQCTPDGVAYQSDRDGPGDFSIKTWNEHGRKQWADAPPLYVQIQSQHCMYVNAQGWGVVAVLFGNSVLERFYLERNDRFITALLDAVEEFWGYVQDRVPPPMDGTVATSRTLSRLHPDDDGSAVALPTEADALLTTLKTFEETKAGATDCVAAIKNQLAAWIGDATYGVTESGRVVSWKSQTRSAYEVSESTFRVIREVKPPRGLALPSDEDYRVAERRQLPRALKQRLLSEDPHCRWCGATLTMYTATWEHIVPLAVGGTNRRNNLTLACEACNQKRGSRAVMEHRT